MKTIIFATGNEGKMREIRMIMADLGLEILSMKEAGIFVEVVEDETTFEEMTEYNPFRGNIYSKIKLDEAGNPIMTAYGSLEIESL